MKIQNLIKYRKKQILRMAEKHGIENVRIFGSFSRGTPGPESDVDFLVELGEGHTLLDLGGFMMDLKELLGRKVDVVTKEGLHWYIRDDVLREARPI